MIVGVCGLLAVGLILLRGYCFGLGFVSSPISLRFWVGVCWILCCCLGGFADLVCFDWWMFGLSGGFMVLFRLVFWLGLGVSMFHEFVVLLVRFLPAGLFLVGLGLLWF